MLRAPWILLGVAAGCATFGEPPEKCEEVQFELYVQGADLMNVNSEGQSMPVEVRAYFLKARDKIDTADFEAVWKDPAAALGPSLLQSTSFTVLPGQEKISVVSAPPATGYVAIVGVFRQVEGQQWRRVVDLRPAVERCRPGDLHTPIRASVRDNRVIAQERVE